MQPGADIFTARQCKRVKADWYVDGPWDTTSLRESAAFANKAFPQVVAEDICNNLNGIFVGINYFDGAGLAKWLLEQPEEIRKIVEKEYRPI